MAQGSALVREPYVCTRCIIYPQLWTTLWVALWSLTE